MLSGAGKAAAIGFPQIAGRRRIGLPKLSARRLNQGKNFRLRKIIKPETAN
jgi:hypothetical protein